MISVDIPRVWNHHEWIQAFEKFLDAIDVHHVSTPFSDSVLYSCHYHSHWSVSLFGCTEGIANFLKAQIAFTF